MRSARQIGGKRLGAGGRGQLLGRPAGQLVGERPVVTEQHGAGRRMECRPILDSEQRPIENEDSTVRLLTHQMPTLSDQLFDGLLQLLGARAGFLVDDHQVGHQPLRPQVLLGPEQVPDQSAFLGPVDSDQDDREVTRDTVSPQSILAH